MKKYPVTIVTALLVTVMMTAVLLAGCGKNYVREGLDLLSEKEYEQAETQFQKAVDDDEEDGEAYRGLGIAKWEQEDYEGARDAFKKALEYDTEKTATIYNFLGNCEMKLDNAKSALNYYRLGLEAEDISDELRQEMRFNEIAAYEQTGDFESAKVKITSYVKDYPEDEKAAKEAEFLETR